MVDDFGSLALGTSSWNFKDWQGAFYPEKIAQADYLPFYIQHFCSVEVNSSFYALPSAKTLIKWVESAPQGFSFALKCPRAITHEKKLQDCHEEALAYLDAIRAMGEAAAPALVQLPPSLSRQSHGRTLAEFIPWLAEHAKGLRVAVEVRAGDLMTERFIDFLLENDLAFVLVDRKGTPDLSDVWMEKVKQRSATNFAYIRWIGDDRNKPPDNRELRTPREEELEKWAERMVEMMDAGLDIFGYMHNPYEGHSPASVRRLQERVGARVDLPVWNPAPPEPFLERKEEDGQLSLFE